MWDPTLYARFADDRSRPFRDLTARVQPTHDPGLVVDLGCGDGPLTLELARRWPRARVVGVDASPEMLSRARELDPGGRVEWVQARAEEWDPSALGAPIDVLVTNATLQWVPTHRDLVPRWLEHLSAAGWFAMQVPANFDAPSHALMREVAAGHPRAAELRAVLDRARASGAATDYLRLLAASGLEADAWETTYLHVLDPAGTQEDPILEWVRGTGLRPVLEVLGDDAESFLAPYRERLRRAYPREPYGVPFPFHRVFAVGRRPGPRGDIAPLVVGLDHVQVSCAPGDEALARAFYGEVLGMEELPKPPVLAARGGCWFRSGAAVVHVGVEPDFAPARKAHPCLVAGDLDEVARRLEAAGHDVTWDDAIPGVRRLHTHDGMGNRVEVQQA